MLNKIFLISLLGVVLSGCGSLDLKDSQDISCQWPFKNHFCKTNDKHSPTNWDKSEALFIQNKEGKSYIQGNLTIDMPTSGTATYRGIAIKYNGPVQRDYSRLSSEFNVDFMHKTISGTIHSGKFPIQLNKAKINNNQFSGGTTNYGGSYSGAFYGNGASELAGTITNIPSESSDIVFSGKRK